MRDAHRSLLTLVAVATLTALAAAPAAGAGPAAATTVNAFSGSLTSSIPNGVPGFRGLEPKLALRYDSSGGNGFAGVGWSLGGVSVVERACPGGGAPRFDATDVYRLDGNVLISCAQAAAPTITGRSDFRWTLASVTDTKGNTVTYGWWCDGTSRCYVDTVSYNGAVVKQWRESRTDAITNATGAGLAQTSSRLKTIDVTMSDSRLATFVGWMNASRAPVLNR